MAATACCLGSTDMGPGREVGGRGGVGGKREIPMTRWQSRDKCKAYHLHIRTVREILYTHTHNTRGS